MKICVINNIFYPYSRGGADKISKTIVDTFTEEGDQVFVITTKPEKKKIDSEGYSVYYLYSHFQKLAQIPLIFRLFWHLGDTFNFISYFKIKTILNKEKPDLVISNNLKGIGFLTSLCIKNNQIKHIHILHDIQLIHPSGLMHYGQEKKINNFVSKLYCKINSWLFRKTDIVVSPSKWLLNFHLEKGFFKNSKTAVIPNPIDTSSKQVDDKKTIPNSFICIGEIEKHKGVLFLLKTFQELNKKENKYKLTFIGEGKESKFIKKAALESDFIEYLGKINNKEVLKRISQAEALIMPSLCYENSPTVIYEAYTQKTPIIASRIGGISELVRKYGGILFNPGDQKNLIEKIKYFKKQENNNIFLRKIDLPELNKYSYSKKIKSL